MITTLVLVCGVLDQHSLGYDYAESEGRFVQRLFRHHLLPRARIWYFKFSLFYVLKLFLSAARYTGMEISVVIKGKIATVFISSSVILAWFATDFLEPIQLINVYHHAN